MNLSLFQHSNLIGKVSDRCNMMQQLINRKNFHHSLGKTYITHKFEIIVIAFKYLAAFYIPSEFCVACVNGFSFIRFTTTGDIISISTVILLKFVSIIESMVLYPLLKDTLIIPL